MTSRITSLTGHKRSKKSYNFMKRQAAECTTATLYKSPLANDTIDSAKPLNVSWDITCFSNVDTIDLRLYSPYAANVSQRRLQIYKSVPYAQGYYQVDLYPRWWDDAPSVQLQFSIQESGNPLGSDYGPGPVFTATYTDDGTKSAATDTSIIDDGYTWIKNIIKSMSGGQIAGAVIGILLFLVLAIGGFFYVRRARAKRAEQTKRFSQVVDKRMSTISANWSSISPTGAQAAIRNSMSVYGRPSGDLAMQSTLSVNTAANASVRANPGNTVGSGLRPQREVGERTGTRVSFAPESMYGRPSSSIRGSMVNGPNINRYTTASDAPPVPLRKTSDMTLSPTQTAGAFALSSQDVDARASQYNPDVMPALQMMRESDGSHELMFSPSKSDAPLPPVPAVTTGPKSPVGMMPMLDSGLSPDALLRGYASNKDGIRRMNSLSVATSRSASPMSPVPSTAGPTYPTPVARTVYTPQTPSGDSNPFRKSVAPTVASAYSGMYDDEEQYQEPQHSQRPNRS